MTSDGSRFAVHLDGIVVVTGAARVHVRGDNAQLSLPRVIGVHVPLSPQPIYLVLYLSLLRPRI